MKLLYNNIFSPPPTQLSQPLNSSTTQHHLITILDLKLFYRFVY